MPGHRQREEVPNVILAEILCGRGIDSAPETRQQEGKQLPDVLIQYRGMRIIIEGKYADTQQAESRTAAQAQARIDLGVAQIALAVLYPPEIRTTPFPNLKKVLSQATFRFCVLSEIGQSQWRNGNIDDILGEIRRAQESMSEKDVVQKAAEELSGYLDGVAILFQDSPNVCDELAEVLGVGRPGAEKRSERAKRQRTTAKVAALTLANAFIFQEQLAGSGVPRVVPLREMLRNSDLVHRSIEHWDWICDEINYIPIFRIAANILGKIPAGTSADNAVRLLAQQSLKVCANKAALRHDLMGRIYHFLLHEAKFLGTYYTSVPAATLLLKLALDPVRWPEHDFSKEDTLHSFRVVDLTCGTGTLLMAACQGITDNFVIASAKNRKKLDAKRFGKLHNALMEHIIHGLDVLPSAIHLTASTLALLSPEVVFDKMHLSTMPLSAKGKTARLGSLEFIESGKSETQLTFFEVENTDTGAHSMTGAGLKGAPVEVPKTDLFVMNPPFTRSVGGNLLFGSLPDAKRKVMQAVLKKRISEQKLLASITAGLGGVFVAVADKYVKPGGRLAFVLPAALTTGVAWDETRRLIQKRYHLEYVVVSHHADRWSFSENTDLSELLFIARRLEGNEDNSDLSTTFANLWRNPDNIGDALAIARLIQKTTPVDISDPSKPSAVANLSELGRKYGEVVSVPMRDMSMGWWGSSFAQTELLRMARCLHEGVLVFPGRKGTINVSMTPLGSIATIGPDRRDIHDGFEIVDHPTSYRAFWNHDASSVLCMFQQPNKGLSPRSTPAPGRDKIRDINLLWPKAGGLLISERLRLNTQRMTAICLDHDVLSNTWWPVRFKTVDKRRDKALALWQNSSLGLAVLLLSRVATEGAWVQFKKPSLLALPVINLDELPEQQLSKLASAFDRLAQATLLPISQIIQDPIRVEVDRAISSALGLPDLASIRGMLGREPIVTNQPILPAEVSVEEESPQMDLLLV